MSPCTGAGTSGCKMVEMAPSTEGDRMHARESSRSCSSVETPRCKAIASRIYTLLPLELRNRIYTFCMQGSYDDEVIIRRSVNSRNAFHFLVRESSGPHAYVWVEDPTASYVSAVQTTTDVAREMLEAYYCTRVFKFSHRELDLLGTFLGQDVFGLGRIPIIYARRLHIQLQPFAHAERSPKQDFIEQQRCHQAVAALAAIRGARIEIVVQFDLDQGLADCAHHEQISPEDGRFLFQIVRDIIGLKEGGLRIEIVFSGTWNEHPSTRVRSRSICSPQDCMARLTKAAQHMYFGEATWNLAYDGTWK